MRKNLLNLDGNDTSQLFFGPDLGLQEYTNPKYKILNDLALEQRSQYWTETEVDMGLDATQWKGLSKEIQDISLLNLSWQTMADSLVGRSPFTTLLPMISNPEYEGMMVQWGFFENLHSRAYSNIIQTVFPNADEVLNQIKTNAHAWSRMEKLTALFNRVHEKSLKYQLGIIDMDEEFKKDVYLTVIAVYGLEAMQFYCSFACTFALAEQDILQGIARNLQLIAKDEALHSKMSMEVIKILRKDPAWKDVINDSHDEASGLLKEIMNGEREWSRYIFSEGRQIIGLNADIMDDYLTYIGSNAFKSINFKVDFEHPRLNPIPWINKYLDSTMSATPPQEAQITNYRVGSMDSDLSGASFDF